MKKIVGVLRPFDLEQSFYVYENGNKIDMAHPTVDEINEVVFSFVEKYNISQVDLTGPKQYSKGIGNKIKEAEMLKYNKNSLEINII